MRIETFRMERMQGRYEHEVEYNLSDSGVLPMRLEELLDGEEATRRLLSTPIGYPPAAGSPALREHIASFYPGAGVENVTVTTGGAEANFVTLWTLLDRSKGDRLAFMIPNYLQGWGLGRHFGAASDAFHLRVRGHQGSRRWALDLEELERVVTGHTRVILVTNPNNPTGAVLTEEGMEAVVRVGKRARAWLVADEVYRGAEVEGETTPTFWGRYDKVVITSGLSKAFALPGLRIGWVVAPPRLIEQLWIHHDYLTLTPGMLSDRLATIATEPDRRERIFARTRSILRKNLPLLKEWVAHNEDTLELVPPLASALGFVRYRLPPPSGALAERIRVEQSVLVVPGEQFRMGKYLRIGYGYDPEALAKGLARIEEVIRQFG